MPNYGDGVYGSGLYGYGSNGPVPGTDPNTGDPIGGEYGGGLYGSGVYGTGSGGALPPGTTPNQGFTAYGSGLYGSGPFGYPDTSGTPTYGSLILGIYETWPNNGGPYELTAGMALGSPQAVTAAIDAALLDGNRITGTRSGNRTISLPITVFGATRVACDRNISLLARLVDSQAWNLTYTPYGRYDTEPPRPIIFECYRGQIDADYQLEQVEPGTGQAGTWQAQLTITVEARPFGRNPNRIILAAVGSPTVLDSLATQTSNIGYAVYDTSGNTFPVTDGINFAGLLYVNAQIPLSGAARTVTIGYGQSLPSVRDLSNVVSITYDHLISNSITTSPSSAQVLTLFDTSGGSATATTTSPGSDFGTFTTATFPIVTFTSTPGFDWAHVTRAEYYLTGVNTFDATTTTSLTGNFRNLVARSAVSNAVIVANGGTYTFAGVSGDARTEASFSLTGSAALGAVVLHRAPAEAPPNYSPLIPLGGVSSPVTTAGPAPITGPRFSGTVHVLLALTATGSGTRTATVTFTQYVDVTNTGSGSTAVTLSRTFVSTDVINGLLDMGHVTLPIRELPAGNTLGGFTFTVSSPGDTLNDLLCLDTRGPTLIAFDTATQIAAFLDEPDPTTGATLLSVGASRATAISYYDAATLDGGPLTLDGGQDNTVLAYATGGAPILAASYYPRYHHNRID